MADTLKDLPQIEAVLRARPMRSVIARYTHMETADAVRAQIGSLRAGLLEGAEIDLPDFNADGFAASIEARIVAARAPRLRRVINATGVLIHTNLGRAPLAPQARAALHAAAAAPSNLELDLATGKRGSRHDHTEGLICALTGAQAAVVVNNCAAAVLLGLTATASGRSVIASRGELIEIGGSYRLPDVITQSGARLHEVGTTNKTRLADYEAAIDENTAVLLKSHTSNFRITGFTAAPARKDLARLAVRHDVILMEDLGSGVLIDLSPYGLPDEPVVRDILEAGVDLVMFSGDKLLGGPQAGIIAGRRDIIARLKAHPLMRALRIDKLSLAALEATLRLYRAPHDPAVDVPVLAMLAEPAEAVQLRANALAEALVEAGLDDVEVVACEAQVGAGALPSRPLESFAVSLRLAGRRAEALTAALRRNDPPIVARIVRERVLLDLRTLNAPETKAVAAALIGISQA